MRKLLVQLGLAVVLVSIGAAIGVWKRDARSTEPFALSSEGRTAPKPGSFRDSSASAERRFPVNAPTEASPVGVGSGADVLLQDLEEGSVGRGLAESEVGVLGSAAPSDAGWLGTPVLDDVGVYGFAPAETVRFDDSTHSGRFVSGQGGELLGDG